MFETEREKLKDQNAIDDYCREYFLRTGKYLENPSPEEILNLVKDYKYFEFAEKELNMSETPNNWSPFSIWKNYFSRKDAT